jgi:hypothetical protein
VLAVAASIEKPSWWSRMMVGATANGTEHPPISLIIAPEWLRHAARQLVHTVAQMGDVK